MFAKVCNCSDCSDSSDNNDRSDSSDNNDRSDSSDNNGRGNSSDSRQEQICLQDFEIVFIGKRHYWGFDGPQVCAISALVYGGLS